MATRAEEPVLVKKFAGLKNTTAPENLLFGEEGVADLQAAVNVDIDNDGGVSNKDGHTLRNAGAYHSLTPDWISSQGTCLLVDGTTLKRLRATAATIYTMDTVRTGLTSGARMSYWMVAGNVYYTNGFETGVVRNAVNRTFGLANPMGQPAAAAIGGGLPAGRYQSAWTYLRNDGQESGSGLAGTFDLTEQGGIGFSGIPVSADPTVTLKAGNITATNGEVLYRGLVIPNADTTANYRNDGLDLRLPLKTQFGYPAPVGHLLAWYRGRMLVAQGSALGYSDPYRYELFMLGKAFLPFDADINLLAPVQDGIYVGADRTYFVTGLWDGVPAVNVVAGYPAIPGTLAYEQGDYIGDGIAGRVAYWVSPRGHCMGANGGQFKNMTESRFSYPIAQRGAGIVRQWKGMNQYLAVLEGTGAASNAFS